MRLDAHRSSWLPGVQITLAYRCRSSRSVFTISPKVSPHISGYNQPIVAAFWAQLVDDQPVRREIANTDPGSGYPRFEKLFWIENRIYRS